MHNCVRLRNPYPGPDVNSRVAVPPVVFCFSLLTHGAVHS